MIRTLLLAVAIAGGVIGAAVGPAPAAGAEPDDKYTQTWSKPYDQTTCLEFRTQITGKQAWVMAADVLTGARNVETAWLRHCRGRKRPHPST